MNFKNLALFCGVLKTLRTSGRAMELGDYVVERKDGEVDGAKIASNF